MTLTDLANPTRFLTLTGRLLPWLAASTALLLLIGLYQSAVAPDDYQQGATVKIMFIHVPNAWLSMFVWGVMSLAALGTLVWRHPLADVAAKAAVGYLLGMGRAADLGADPVSDVSRPDRAVARG
jgi:heme exporter protein C